MWALHPCPGARTDAPLVQNIELKVRHPEPLDTRGAAHALGAQHVWTQSQCDTYFAVPDARLKVREMPEHAEVILYRRPNDSGLRISNYLRLPVRDGAAARAMLGAVWPPHGVVRKVRELWLWENVRIHFDTVDTLGTFIELEGVIGPDADASCTRTRVDRVIEALGLGALDAVPGSYRDLVTADVQAAVH